MGEQTAIIIATEGTTTNLLSETLSSITDLKAIIIEKPISRRIILKRRLKKIGLMKVVGQLLFMAIILPLLRLKSKQRISQIITNHGLSNIPINNSLIRRIDSVNNIEIVSIIQDINPDLIFINGTRIISGKILDALQVKPINLHVGITPKYRGIHGGYWALYNNDAELFGTTLHQVNSGIDLGAIIDQKTIKPTEMDNFTTYPFLQYCEGLEMIKTNIKEMTNPQFKSSLSNESHLFYHPTLFQYIKARLFKRIR